MTNPSALALDGIKVIALARNLAGPYAPKIVATLGADVMKVERPIVGKLWPSNRNWVLCRQFRVQNCESARVTNDSR